MLFLAADEGWDDPEKNDGPSGDGEKCCQPKRRAEGRAEGKCSHDLIEPKQDGPLAKHYPSGSLQLHLASSFRPKKQE